MTRLENKQIKQERLHEMLGRGVLHEDVGILYEVAGEGLTGKLTSE